MHLLGLPVTAVICAALGAACDSSEPPNPATGGTTSSTGGAASGGQGVSGGQTGSGGLAAVGGAASGGKATGGKATGGAPSGGTATGGKATGGSGGKPFKGVANSPAGEIAALGATWCYNWGTSP
jgi:hypothetical protein